MWILNCSGLRAVDTKTGKSFSCGKDQKTQEFNLYVPYFDAGETKNIVHKKFKTAEDAQNYMAQFVDRLNKAHYSNEKILKVFLYKKE